MSFGLINGTANVIIRFWFLNLCVCCHLCASCTYLKRTCKWDANLMFDHSVESKNVRLFRHLFCYMDRRLKE
jgi:hypothetical protein